MPRIVIASSATAAHRRAYFDLRDVSDGLTPETGEAGGQPQISTNGGAWTNTGIGTLTHIGNGRYYADMTTGAIGTAGDVIETRFKSANTVESPGDTFQVVAFDPNSATSLGLSNLDAAISSVETDTQDIQGRLPAALVGGRMDSDAVAISGSTTAADDVQTNIGNLNAAITTRSSHTAADVWTSGTRTLTSFGTLIADIWANVTRTLTQTVGDATAANQTTVLNRIGTFTGTGINTVLGFFQAVMRSDASNPSDLGGTYDAAADSLEAIRGRGDAAWLTGGVTGSNTVTITLKDTDTNGVLIPDATCTLKDSGGTTILDMKISEADGTVTFALNDGTYQVHLHKLGSYTFTVPETLVVDEDPETIEYYGTPFSASAPSSPDTCTVFGWIVDAGGVLASGTSVTAVAVASQFTANNQGVKIAQASATTDVNGYFEIEVVRGIRYTLTVSDFGYTVTTTIPASASVNFKDLTDDY